MPPGTWRAGALTGRERLACLWVPRLLGESEPGGLTGGRVCGVSLTFPFPPRPLCSVNCKCTHL